MSTALCAPYKHWPPHGKLWIEGDARLLACRAHQARGEPVPEALVWRVLLQVGGALRYLHAKHVAHRWAWKFVAGTALAACCAAYLSPAEQAQATRCSNLQYFAHSALRHTPPPHHACVQTPPHSTLLPCRRDVKPENILCDADGTFRLADLGVAKLLRGPFMHTRTLVIGRAAADAQLPCMPCSAGATTTVVYTSANHCPLPLQVGTPGYIAPEVWLGQGYSFSCDLYSLGCVAYEMAAGRRPFARPAEEHAAGVPMPLSQVHRPRLHPVVKVFAVCSSLLCSGP